MEGMKVLVTGAGGFIGSHLCERLVADGAGVKALCRYTSRRDRGNLADLEPEVAAELDVHFGDLRDVDFVRRLVADVDAVLHLGASISVPYSYVAPGEVVTTNVEGTLGVLDAARARQSPPRVVHLSSSEVYGTAQTVPIAEEHPLHAQSPYAASKVGADKLAETFHLSFDLPVVVARPFNTFGPRQSPRAVIGTIVRQAVAGERLRLGDTTPRRDFVFVTDTVAALVGIAASDLAGDVYNIATGEDHSVADVVATVGELLGRELEVESDAQRLRPESSEVYRLVGDATKLRDAIGWEPRVDLREGLGRMIEWVRERGGTEGSDRYEI